MRVPVITTNSMRVFMFLLALSSLLTHSIAASVYEAAFSVNHDHYLLRISSPSPSLGTFSLPTPPADAIEKLLPAYSCIAPTLVTQLTAGMNVTCSDGDVSVRFVSPPFEHADEIAAVGDDAAQLMGHLEALQKDGATPQRLEAVVKAEADRLGIDHESVLGGIERVSEWPLSIWDYFDPRHLVAWELNYLREHWGPLPPFPTYNQSNGESGVYDIATGKQVPLRAVREEGQPLDEEVRIAIASDWGAGTPETQAIANQLEGGFEPHYTVHLGDIYLIGSKKEIREHALGVRPSWAKRGVKWTHGSLASFALNANHEMYSRGYGYFDVLLPTLGPRDASTGHFGGQKASYFALRSPQWWLIFLDTGYYSYNKDGATPGQESHDNHQPQAVVQWLKNIIRPDDTRGLVFFTHHQYRSAFEGGYYATPRQLIDEGIVPANNRTVLWLWGHEHRLAAYAPGTQGGVPLMSYGRCVGNSGYPVLLASMPARARESKLQVYDNRVYATRDVKTVGYNGYARMYLNKDGTMKLQYFSVKLDPSTGQLDPQEGDLLMEDTWTVDQRGNVVLKDMQIINSDLTVVSHHGMDADEDPDLVLY
ncbi:unnamed protein product [Vitrella brassicaformis CCMP3155]|uniref:Calcineurin-like phosphoesterase domain-containing protein n=1 Tax=Vitrella brassicaformis (strain CCMP3155) TaxID=1169540 RepID=A0A0G4EER5_VITBC|nr:unnamed protein product [Vitrella brassicaformis CCMP3155]|mmetsp:Transcript_41315/g.117351  ORF Transcript_41315/g.117351 Transcript_41315/m.117351 type:complete len:593 (+) Transcript_41315:14-1792(+)|eukprot:CEL94176.1 unnamed protein product [Vitrella brassicaformis CCMP3155]